MDISPEQYEKLIAYFESRMTAEEEILLLEALEKDAALQKAFEWEMILRYPSWEDEVVKEQQPGLESAAAHLEQVKNELGEALKKQRPAIIRPIWRLAAATIAIFLLVAAGLWYYRHRTDEQQMVDRHVVPAIDTSFQKQLVPDTPVLATNSIDIKALYRKYYALYEASEDDPVELSKFLYAYNDGRYKEILAGNKEDLVSKGTTIIDQRLKAYLAFYKGLAYLQLDKPGQAARQFKIARHEIVAKDSLQPRIGWYLALAYLSAGDKAAAVNELKTLTEKNSDSNYQPKATRILEKLQESQ